MQRRQEAFEASMSQYLKAITEAQARANSRNGELQAKAWQAFERLSQEMTSLRDVVERYIRFRGDGGSAN